MANANSGKGETRRERGVIAQREYRKRHANKFKTLQDENDNLKVLIRDIVLAAKGEHDLDSELRSALSRAEQTVGDHAPGEGAAQASGSRPPSQPGSGRDHDSEPNGAEDISAKSLDRAFEKSFRPTHPDDVYPPSTTGPYLGDGMFTVAGRLFWDHMAYINIQLQKHAAMGFDTDGDSSDPKTEDFADYERIIALGTARLDYYRRLNQPSCPLSDDADSLTRLLQRQKTLKENALARRAEFWKNPTQVAEMIIERSSREEGHTLMAALSGRLGAREQRIAGQRLAPYARNAVSFEDGPYWSVLFVSLHLGSYLPISAGDITPSTHPGTV